jgi:hypothetical protein
MTPDFSSQFEVYGPLGIVCIMLITALISVYNAKEKQSADFQSQIAKLQSDHRNELSALVERHIAKAEAWNDRWSDIAGKLHTVLEGVLRKGGRA